MLQQILECGLQKSIPTQGEVHYCNILYYFCSKYFYFHV